MSKGCEVRAQLRLCTNGMTTLGTQFVDSVRDYAHLGTQFVDTLCECSQVRQTRKDGAHDKDGQALMRLHATVCDSSLLNQLPCLSINRRLISGRGVSGFCIQLFCI